MAPRALGGRAAALATLYQFYRFKKILFKYVPSCPTETGGSLGMSYRTEQTLGRFATPGINTVRTLASAESYVATTLWNPTQLEVIPSSMYKWYRCSPGQDAPLDTQGIFALVAAATFDTETAETTYGQIYIEYEIEFANPMLVANLLDANVGYITFSVPTDPGGSGMRAKRPVIMLGAVVPGFPSTSSAVSYSYDIVYECVVQSNGNTWFADGGANGGSVALAGTSGSITWYVGMPLYMRVNRVSQAGAGSGTTVNVFTFYNSLDEAVNADTPSLPEVPGATIAANGLICEPSAQQLLFNNALSAGVLAAGDLVMKWRAHPLTQDDSING
jgi:hypothetical protein